MAYYLSEFVGTGSELDPFRPPVTGEYEIIDLRGDTTVVAGRCLLWTPADLPSDSRYEKVADATVESIPRNIARRIENALGVTLTQFDTLQAIIAELLILHGSFTDPGRWNPLRANRFGRHVIHLGGKVYDAPAPVGAIITDDFNRADSGSLGVNWTEVVTGFSIVSNEAESDTSGGNLVRYDGADLDSADHYAQFDETSETANSDKAGVCARFSASAQTFYMGRVNTGTSEYQLYNVTTGSFNEIAIGTFVSRTLPVTMKLEVDGSAIALYEDDVSKVNTTNTGIPGNTRAGIRIRGAGGTVDNFEAADLGAVFDPANLQASVLDDDVTLTHDSSF